MANISWEAANVCIHLRVLAKELIQLIEPKRKSMPKPKQVMRFSNKELITIKGVFAENDELLRTIRKVFYQMPLNAIDLSALEVTFKNKPELNRIMRKCFLPEIEADVPFQQQIDLWMTIRLKEMIVDEASVHLDSIQIWIDYIGQQLEVLKGGKRPKISFKELSNIKEDIPTAKFAKMLARNTIINHVEQQLNQLLVLAGMKTETPEETVERLQKDSNK